MMANGIAKIRAGFSLYSSYMKSRKPTLSRAHLQRALECQVEVEQLVDLNLNRATAIEALGVANRL